MKRLLPSWILHCQHLGARGRSLDDHSHFKRNCRRGIYPKTDREQKCEARFYAGSRRLIDGDMPGAKDLFQKCLATDVKSSTEYESAAAELEALKKK